MSSAPLSIDCFFMSCEERRTSLETSRRSLELSGGPARSTLVLDDGKGATQLDRIHRTWRRMLKQGASSQARYTLFLEDDVIFGRHFWRNLQSWPLLQEIENSQAFYASLYNPGMPYIKKEERERYYVAYGRNIWGSQALLLTPGTARFIDEHWEQAQGNPDMRMPRLASRITPVYLHLPSLVDHAPVETTWGGMKHQALDFKESWRAPEAMHD